MCAALKLAIPKATPHKADIAASPATLPVLFPKNAREYTQYSLCFLGNLPSKSARRFGYASLCGIALNQTKRGPLALYASINAKGPLLVL